MLAASCWAFFFSSFVSPLRLKQERGKYLQKEKQNNLALSMQAGNLSLENIYLTLSRLEINKSSSNNPQCKRERVSLRHVGNQSHLWKEASITFKTVVNKPLCSHANVSVHMPQGLFAHTGHACKGDQAFAVQDLLPLLHAGSPDAPSLL